MSNPRVVVEFISRGTQQVAQQTQSVQNSVSGVADAADDAVPAMALLGAGIAAVVAGMTALSGIALLLANRTADMAEESKKFARQLGITTDQWERQKRVLGEITRKEGKDTFELLKNLRQQQVKAATEGGKSEKVFNALGIAFKGADGSLVPLETLLENTLNTLRDLPGPLSQTVAANQLFGESMTADVLAVLERSSEEMTAMGDKAESLGILLGEDMVREGKKFNDTFLSIGRFFKDFTDLLGQYLLVNINQMIDSFIEFYNNSEFGRKRVGELIGAFSLLIEIIGSVVVTFRIMGDLFLRVLDHMGEAFGNFFGFIKTGFSDALDQLKSGNVKGAFAAMTNAADEAHKMTAESLQRNFGNYFEETKVFAIREMAEVEAFSKRVSDLASSSIEQITRKKNDLTGGLSAPEFGGASDVSAAADLQSRFSEKDPKSSLSEATQEVRGLDRITDRLKKNTLGLASAWGDVGTNIADVATDSIVYLADGMTNAITGMITGTQTLAESFQQMAVSIVRSIVQMIVQWIVFALIVAPIMSMLTWGASTAPAAAGSASMMGIIGSAASTGAAFGASQTTTAKADGGLITGGQQLALVNERGEEFVFSAEAVRNLGVGFLENLHAQASGITAGIPATASMPAPNVNVSPSEATVIIVNDRAELLKTLASRAGQKITVHNIRGNRIKAGIPT